MNCLLRLDAFGDVDMIPSASFDVNEPSCGLINPTPASDVEMAIENKPAFRRNDRLRMLR